MGDAAQCHPLQEATHADQPAPGALLGSLGTLPSVSQMGLFISKWDFSYLSQKHHGQHILAFPVTLREQNSEGSTQRGLG